MSGAVLLNKEESILTIIKKRVSKTFIGLLLVSLMYYFIDVGLKINFIRFLNLFFSKNLCFALWFLYAYIALLLVLPILRALAKNLSNEHYLYLFSIILLVKGVLPFVNMFVFSDKLPLNKSFLYGFSSFTNLTFAYPLLGYYIHFRMDIKRVTGKLVSLLWIFNILCIIVSSFMTYNKTLMTNKVIQSGYTDLFLLLKVATIFITIKWIFENKIYINNKLNCILLYFSSLTYGIYLLHVVFLRKIPVTKNLIIEINKYIFDPFVSAMLYCIVIMIFSGLATAVLKKVPYLKEIF